MTKVKPLIDKYNWEGINYRSEKDDWKIFEKNNLAIALNILYAKYEKIYLASIWKHNSNCEKQVTVLMILNTYDWHYIVVKELKNNGDFYCLDCCHSFKKTNKFNWHKIVYKNKVFCNVVMPSEDTNSLVNSRNLIKHNLLFM